VVLCNLYVNLDFTFEWNLESFGKIGRQILISPGTRECDLGVSVSLTPVDYGRKKNVGENWDQVARQNRGLAGKGRV
jgi:hypothetical protein